MTTDRAYRKARPTREAIAELRRNSSTQFDPVVVETLCAIVEEDELQPIPLRPAPQPLVELPSHSAVARQA
jgi:HD-GYP domain-containing protein (c-di-GMP phosphodiesterase class II)